MLTLSSCSNEHEEPQPVVPIERTVLVYMVAANSLGQPGYEGGEKVQANDSADLDEMKKALPEKPANVRWLVMHATYSGSSLMELTGKGFKTLKTYGPGYSTTASFMTEVIDDVQSIAPAQDYGIVLWSHANGWLEDSSDDTDISTLSFGLHGGHKMNTTTLSKVIEGKGFDYIYFDCCLMGSAEVMYELRKCAKYVVATQSEIPLDGMPYDKNLPLLCKGDRASLIQAATNTYEHYNNLPVAEDRTCAISVVATEGLDELAAATKEIYCITSPEHPLSPVTNYYGSASVRQGYYLDFGEYVEALIQRDAVNAEMATRWHEAMNEAVIYHAATEKLWDSWPMFNTSGLSTRVFNSVDYINVKGYDRLQWAQDVVAPRFSTK
ncbi:MAG: clostripain-related cysteine peptidase [Muribaculaceae bacterium]